MNFSTMLLIQERNLKYTPKFTPATHIVFPDRRTILKKISMSNII
jgi:hypothetical protein